MFEVEVPDGRIVGDVSGDGPPLVLLHAGVADRRMWNRIVPTLERSFTVVRFDFRGFGDSSSTDKPYVPRDDLLAVLDRLDIGSAHLVGASMGGIVAMEAALAQPERVDSLILLAPGLPGREPSPEREAYGVAEEAAVEAGDAETVIQLDLDFWVRGPRREWSPRLLEIADELREQVSVLIANQITAEDLGDWAQPPIQDNLHRIAVPTVVVVAEADPSDIVANGEYIAEQIPGARLVRFADTAHLPAVERPAETIELIIEAVA